MRTLKNPNEMPPTGFFFIDPDTNYMVESGSLSTTIRLATAHRNGNNLEIPENFAAIIEDFICVNNDPDFSEGDSDRKFNVPLTESWIRSSMQDQLLAWKANGREFVESQVADRRGEICSHCQYNVRSPVCFSCVGLDVLGDSYFKRSSSVDSQLRVCKLTAVPNASQIHIPGEALLKRQVDFPEPCWYKAELEKEDTQP